MTVLRQYNSLTSQWDIIFVGDKGDPGIHTGNTAPSDTSILWADTSDPGDMVIPQGGTTGQSLTKLSNSNYNTGWLSTWEDDQTVLSSQVFG